MERKLKIVAMVTIVTATIGLILMFLGLFSAGWITGDLQMTSKRNHREGKVSNTSGSCSEGLFVKCCEEDIDSYNTSGFRYADTSEYSCYVRHKNDFQGQLFGAYQAARALAGLSVSCSFLGMVLSWLFYFIKKIQERLLVPFTQMVLFYVAVLSVTIDIVMVGTDFKKFTALLQPEIGSSLYIAVGADVVVLAAAIASTVAFAMVRRRRWEFPYGTF